MKKKEYILRVLNKVLPYWKEASFIQEKILVPTVKDDYIENIYQKCVKAVDFTLHQQSEHKVQQLWQYLESLQAQERVSQEADQKDIENLENLLHNF